MTKTVDQKKISKLFFPGPPGVGKTAAFNQLFGNPKGYVASDAGKGALIIDETEGLVGTGAAKQKLQDAIDLMSLTKKIKENAAKGFPAQETIEQPKVIFAPRRRLKM
jgi:ATP-dependent Clp protease ATP-binding subunit ClpA